MNFASLIKFCFLNINSNKTETSKTENKKKKWYSRFFRINLRKIFNILSRHCLITLKKKERE